jgi:hypothetical protein
VRAPSACAAAGLGAARPLACCARPKSRAHALRRGSPPPPPSRLPLPGLLKWVFAMVNYFGVAKGVEPKRKKVGRGARPAGLRWEEHAA